MYTRSFIIKLNTEKIIALIAGFCLWNVTIRGTSSLVLGVNGFVSSVLVYVFMALYILSVIGIIFYMNRKGKTLQYFLIFVAFSLLFVAEYFIYPSNRELILYIFKEKFIYVLLVYFAVGLIDDYDTAYSVFKGYMWVVYVLIMLEVLFVTNKEGHISISAPLITPLLMFLYEAVYREKKKYWIPFIAGAIAALIYGGRAVILCILFGIVLFAIKNIPQDKRLKRRKTALLCTIVVVVLIVAICYQPILQTVGSWLERAGINSRNYTLITSRKLTDLTGRNAFYKLLFEKNKVNPWGYGIGGDMLLCGFNLNIGRTYSEITGAYAHNGILESVTEFGILIGLVIWIVIVTRFVKSYKRSSFAQLSLLVLLAASGLCRVFLGNPYWYDLMFGGYLAVSNHILRCKSLNVRSFDKADSRIKNE